MSGQAEQLQALIPDHHQKKINQNLPGAVDNSSYMKSWSMGKIPDLLEIHSWLIKYIQSAVLFIISRSEFLRKRKEGAFSLTKMHK
jgi:hypothetical protein